jgi:hypothetical protein
MELEVLVMASPLLAPALAETVIITYRGVKNGSNANNPIPHFPIPSQLVSVLIIYGGLSLFPQSAERLAAAVGWGFVVATLLNLYEPGGKVISTNNIVSSNVTAGSELVAGTTSATS